MNTPSSAPGGQTPLSGVELQALGAQLSQSIKTSDKHGWSVMPTQKEQLDAEWKQVVAALRQCQARLARHPKVPFFTISRDETEVSVKVSDGSSPRGAYVILSRSHPTRRDAPPTEVWLTEVGQPEKAFADAADAMAELIGRVASRI